MRSILVPAIVVACLTAGAAYAQEAPAETWPGWLSQGLVPAGILMLAVAMPFGILVSRDNVRARRREIIASLEKFFTQSESDLASTSNSNWQIIPSFEFVKSKYFNDQQPGNTRDVSIRFFSVPIIIFTTLCFVMLIYAFAVPMACFTPPLAGQARSPGCWINHTALAPSIFLAGGAVGTAELPLVRLHEQAATIAVFAFLGAYLASLKLFIRAVANFDLTPLTFFRANLYIIGSALTAIVLWRGGQIVFGENGFILWLAVAFVIGLYPALGERLLSKLWRQGMLKKTDERAMEQTRTVPLELIDGVDADIRARLEDHNLYDVQNLATANPIILFVETPFGIYQSIDWVGQAQLATAVGVSRFLTLRDLGIRTIFDFERALGPGNITSPENSPGLAGMAQPVEQP